MSASVHSVNLAYKLHELSAIIVKSKCVVLNSGARSQMQQRLTNQVELTGILTEYLPVCQRC